MSKNKKRDHIFSSDRPIVLSSDDLFGRAYFAKELSDSINNWKEEDSLVVAVYGNWGDGKTSFKNLIVEHLEENKSNKIDVIEFNPWQWSHNKDIIKSFIKELSNSILKKKFKNAEKFAHKLKQYGEYLHLSSDALTSIGKNIGKVFLVISIALGFLSLKIPNEMYSYIGIIISVILLIFSQSISCIAWSIEIIQKFYEIKSKNQMNLEERKNELKKLMSQHTKTVLIIIDDIDRLEPEEIRDLFKMIKSNLDLPKIVYLTLFQRDIVEKTLTTKDVFSGKDYLEKIIQIGVDLPSVSKSSLDSIFFKKLDVLIEEFNGMKHFERGRWNELYSQGISTYFDNLRDVNRFISSLHFQLGALTIKNVLEVNFIDLIGVEVLRQFESETFKALFKNKKILTSNSTSGMRDSSEEERKKIINEILNLPTENTREYVKSILKVLFPNIQSAWSNYHTNVDDNDFIKLRICHENRFDRYFSFFKTEEDFFQYEFEEILSATSDKSLLLDKFVELQKNGRLEPFLDKFESYKQHIPSSNALPFLSAMFCLGDIVSDEFKGFMSLSSLTRVKRIIVWFLKKSDLPEPRRDLFLKAIDGTIGISLPISELWNEYTRESIDKYPDLYSLNPEDEEVIKNKILEIISKHKSEVQFQNNIHLNKMLYIWKQLDKKASNEWINNYLQEDKNFLFLLNQLISKSFSQSGYNTNEMVRIPIDWMSVFFDVPSALKRFESIEVTAYSDQYPNLKKAMERAKLEHSDPKKYGDLYAPELDK